MGLALAALATALFWISPAWAQKPKIAVIIDDFGLDYRKTPPDQEWCSLPFPLTFAVMPRSPRTKKAADMIKASGKELIIHFPFDPFLKLELPKGEEPSKTDVQQVSTLLKESFETILGAVGLNTHRSLKATQNPALMRWFMKEYKKRGLFFVDSAVSPKTVAYSEALAAGVPAVKNSLFLEGARPDKGSCRRALRRTAKLAKRLGRATAIGHHYHRSTYACLKEEVPKLEQEGFEFVFASQIAQSRE
ncbi:MAG: divergent polysaccharide deacetylase family protein [Elusimicrobia bacterium]|nr:divergent polysaccharide deacetylase family protein [Elusimicrobiota bacterium]